MLFRATDLPVGSSEVTTECDYLRDLKKMTTKKIIVIKSAGTTTGILQFPTEQDILDAIPLLDRGDENFIEIILENVDDTKS